MMKFSVPPKFSQVVDWDTGVRQEQTIEALTKLRPFFDKKFGSITAGNSSQITDGAAMVIIASEEGLAKLGNVKPLAIIKDFAFAGLEPKRMGLGPVYATQKLNKQMGAKLSDYQRVEINEAFSAQVIACLRAFSSAGFCQENFGEGAMGDIDPNILNPNGGAVAIGHPVGATGTRLVLTLAHELQRSKKELGLASLCIGGGQGGAMALEAVA